MRRMPILCRNRFLWIPGDVSRKYYAVLAGISSGYPPAKGRLHTCYSPVRRSPADKASFIPAAPRLACVKPVASVHPEPGSNSSLLLILFLFFQKNQGKNYFSFLPFTSARESVCFLSRSSSAFLYWVSALQNWLETCASDFRRLANALVLLLVYCNRFNVLFCCAQVVSWLRVQSYALFLFPPNIFKKKFTLKHIFNLYSQLTKARFSPNHL